jgi:hypothetical protein
VAAPGELKVAAETNEAGGGGETTSVAAEKAAAEKAAAEKVAADGRWPRREN